MIKYYTLLITLVLLINSCATSTVLRGSSQDLTITTDPPGATIIVDQRDEYLSPATISISRKELFTYIMVKKEDYLPIKGRIGTEYKPALGTAGNVIAGLIPIVGIGSIVDSSTGADMALSMNKIDLKLIPRDLYKRLKERKATKEEKDKWWELYLNLKKYGFEPIETKDSLGIPL